jgi:hypothetical protein
MHHTAARQIEVVASGKITLPIGIFCTIEPIDLTLILLFQRLGFIYSGIRKDIVFSYRNPRYAYRSRSCRVKLSNESGYGQILLININVGGVTKLLHSHFMAQAIEVLAATF